MQTPPGGPERPGPPPPTHPDGRPGHTDQLTAHEQAILDFERTWHRRPGARTQAIYDQFALSETRYYAELNELLERRAALACAPAVVNRLRAARDRAAGRSHR